MSFHHDVACFVLVSQTLSRALSDDVDALFDVNLYEYCVVVMLVVLRFRFRWMLLLVFLARLHLPGDKHAVVRGVLQSVPPL